MGQRSQLYVFVKDVDGNINLMARYFQWNFGIGMVSRAAEIVRELKHNIDRYDNGFPVLSIDFDYLARIADVNFDTRSVTDSTDIVEEFKECYHEIPKEDRLTVAEDLYEYVFCGQDNNNGQLYIYLDLSSDDRQIYLGFTSDCTINTAEHMLTAGKYLSVDIADDKNWETFLKECEYPDYNEGYEYTKENVQYLQENTKLIDRAMIEDVILDFCDKRGYELERAGY